MADGNVDNLNIQISAEAKSAEKSLNSLSQTLLRVNKNLQSSVGTIRKVSKEVGTLQSAVNSLGKTSINSSGIGKTINSLRRLLKVDASGFDTDGFRNITDTIRQLGNMPDVSNNVNRFVSSMARLANAGEKTGQTSNDIKRLGEQTRLAAKELKGIGDMSNELNMFVQSIGRLASAGNKTGQTASSLRTLAKETLEFFNAMAKAPRISENTIRMTQALAQLASAGGRVSTATNTISSAFNKLSSIGGKTLSAMKKVASGIVSAFKQIGNSGKHVDTARFSLGNLLKTAIGFRLGYGVLEFGRQAFELGSSITEVENVVNVAFGNMADKAYEFASTAKEQFGISELAALNYSGTMMAILNSSGVAQDAAAEMSTTLAGLAGDLASFYNISQDNAWEKLMSGMAGEIEPLRRLGINLSVANLQAYALSQGITKSWQSMTQAEQVMLRYNYLMQLTAQQQGDWARTSMTWANQLRLLQLNIQSLASTIGQGLIAAVLPALQALNVLMSVLQRAAEAFRDFMYVLTGYKPQSSGGIVNDLAGIGDTASDLGDLGFAGDTAAGGLDDATSAAEDLKKALSVLSFDELNQLSDTSVPDASTPSSGSGGGGAGGLGGGSGFGGLDSITDALGKSELPEAINEWAERIRDAFLDHDWDRLGEEIAWGINKGMQAIYDAIRWENVGPKITAFTSAFTQTMNSLVNNINWELMGKVVGAGVNTIVNTLNQLIEGFDFTNLGSKLSEGLRGAISEIQWTNLGNLLGNYFMIPWNMLSGFITQMAQKNDAGLTGFEQLGISLGNAFNGIFDKIDFGVIGTTLANGINGAFQVLRNFVATVEWDDLAVNIYTGLNNMINGIDWATAGATLSEFVTELLGTFVTVAQNTDWEGLGRGIGEMLSNIDWLGIFTGVIEIISEILGGLIKGLGETTAGKVLLAIGTVAAVFKGVQIVTAAKSAIDKVLSTWGFLPKGIEGKTPLISGAISKLGPILAKVGGFAKTAISTAVGKIGELAKGIIGKIPSIGSAIGQVGSKLMTLVPKAASMVTGAVGKLGGLVAAIGPAGWIAIGIGAGVVAIIANWDKVKEAAGVVKDWVVEKWSQLKEKTSEIWGNIKDFAGKTWDDLSSWASEKFGNIKESVSNAWENAKKKTSEIWSNVKETAGNIWGGMKETAGNVFSDIKSNVSSAWEGAKNLTSSAWDGISSWVSRIWSGMDSDARSSFDNIDRTISNSSSYSSDTISREWSRVRDSLSGVFDGMKIDAQNGIDSIVNEFSNLSWKISDAVGDLYWTGRDAAQSFADGFQSVYIPTPHMYVSSWDYHDLGNGKSVSTPNFDVQWYAKGGLFTKATLAGIGEAGKEAVLPLENRRTMSMIADSIMGNATTGMSEEALTNAVTAGVTMALMNNQGNQTPINLYATLYTEDNEVLARAVAKGQESIDYRYNPTPQFG